MEYVLNDVENYTLEKVRCPICDHSDNVTYNSYDLRYYCGDCGNWWEAEPIDDELI